MKLTELIKELIAPTIIVLFLWLMTYLLFSFGCATFNIVDWPWSARFFCSFIAGAIVVGAIVLTE